MTKDIKPLPVQPGGLTPLDENIEAIEDILYFTDRRERNASVGQSWVELRFLLKSQPDIQDADTLYKALFSGKTSAGFKFLTCRNNLKELERRHRSRQISGEDQRSLQLWYCYGSDRGRHYMSINRVFLDLRYRWNHFERVFRNKIGKIAFDLIYERLNPIQNEIEGSDEQFFIG